MTNWANRTLNALLAIAFVAAAIAFGGVQPAKAQAAPDDLSAAMADRPSHVATTWDGVAAVGYDVVAFFLKGEAIKGSRSITATHMGATYRFTTEDHKALFLKDPAALAPQYGGYGAMGIRMGKKLRPDRSPAWQVANEKLFFFIDDETKAMWNEDSDTNQRVAEAIWSKIENVPLEILHAPVTN